jgi:hypothetical protein
MAVVTGLSTLTGGFNQVVSSGLVQAQNLSAAVSLITQYTNGTGAGQIDLLYAKRLTFVASTPQTLDLILAFSDPVTVGASKGYIVSGTSKNLKIDPGSNVIVLDLLIAGCSAAS